MRGALRCAGVCLLMCFLSWAAHWAYQPPDFIWPIVGSLWVLGGVGLLHRGAEDWPRIARILRLMGGVLALWVTWLALYQAKVMGTNFIFSLLLLVWVADVGAYFSGRAFGRRKLAVHISPGKSWEGVWGGMAAVVVMALIWVWIDEQFAFESQSLFSRLYVRGWPFLLLATVFLVAMSVVGDLVESLVKRSAGMKDSSLLLPGHGGVLDRVDALLPTLPIALMLLQPL
jgi:phosphatidate cytidylyltransferase